MKQSVFLLHHYYETDYGCDEVKILGIFSSYEKAEIAAETYKNLPGFKEHKDSFYIDKYELNKKFWIEGFGGD